MRFILTCVACKCVFRQSLESTYAVLSTAAGLLGLLLCRLGLLLGFLLGRLGLGLLLGGLGLRLLLLGLGLLLLLLLGLLLLARGLRSGLLVLGGGLLGLLLCLLSTRRRGAANLKLDDILADGDGVLLVDKELLDGTGLGRVQRNVDLVGLDGSDLLILLDVVANLCGLSVSVCVCSAATILTFRPLLQCTLGDGLSHLGDLDGGDIGCSMISTRATFSIVETDHSFLSGQESKDAVSRAVQVV